MTKTFGTNNGRYYWVRIYHETGATVGKFTAEVSAEIAQDCAALGLNAADFRLGMNRHGLYVEGETGELTSELADKLKALGFKQGK